MKGNNIYKERHRIINNNTFRQLSRRELAIKVNITEVTIRKWEEIKLPESIMVLARMADLFGCSVDYLIGRTDVREIGGRNENSNRKT